MNSSISKILTVCVSLFILAPSYATDTFPDFPVRLASEYNITAQSSDVTIGLQPLEDIASQRTYFHTDLTSKGFVPVFLVLHNGSKSESVLLDTTKIYIDSASSHTSAPKVGTKGAATATGFAVAATPFGGAVAAPVVAAMYAHASRIQQNFMLKELKSQTLSPGESACGFLYVAIPKTGTRPKIHIKVPAIWVSSGMQSLLNLSF